MFRSKIASLIGAFIRLTWAQQDESSVRPPEEVTVNVHFLTHSHMDAGWLLTYDSYYERNVRFIFESVFQEL